YAFSRASRRTHAGRDGDTLVIVTFVGTNCAEAMTLSSSPETQHTRNEFRSYPARVIGITIAACLIFWVFVFGDSGWGPNLTPLSNQLHLPLVTVGLFYVLWSTGYLPGALIGGIMLDRYGPRRVFFGAALIVFGGISSIFLGLLLPHLVPVVILLVFA